jgi:hypothetical protein
VAGLQTGEGRAPQPSPAPQPASSPHTSMPPTSNEFVQQVVAGRNLSRSEIPTLSGPGRETSKKSSLP